MTNDNGMKQFCLGLGIGVAAAMFFAPRSGRDSRRMLRDKAQEGADYLKKQGEELKRQGQDLANSANEAMERGMRTVRQQAEGVMAAVDAGRSAYRDSMAAPVMNGR